MQLNYEQQLDYIEANGTRLSQGRHGIIHNGKMYIIYYGGTFDSRDTTSFTANDFEILVGISEKEKERLSQEIMSEQIDE